MTTRLDRLFLLLETGSTPVTRRAAAQQLGEVQKLHPHELHNLLAKIHVYLKSSTWETRIAAGQAIEAVAKNVPQWAPVIKIKEEGLSASPRIMTPVQREMQQLKFGKFNIGRVLACGSSLLGSAGTEYEVSLEETGCDSKERLLKQRHLLQKRLGLDDAGGILGMNSSELFNDDDLIAQKVTPPQSDVYTLELPTSIVAADIVAQEMAQMGSGLSSREKNRAKRKAKILLKQRSKENSDAMGSSLDSVSEEPLSKKSKMVKISSQSSFTDTGQSDQLTDGSVFYEEPGEWPFASYCEQLSNDLFHHSWEVRHGASTGIRELVKIHGLSAGKSLDYPLDQQDSLNQVWLEDMALRLLCVLALDRFGDFVSDEVVAPVRETCAQALGIVLHHMTSAGVDGVLGILLQLLSQRQWEVRHGGLLGMKYLLAVRKEMIDQLLPAVLPYIIVGLQDIDDDVRAVAAAALNPVSDALVRVCPDQVMTILNTLWNILLDLDDLTASTNSIMMLLASLLSYPALHNGLSETLTSLVPRLWPFLRHNISSVRKAVLETLCMLVVPEGKDASPAVWLLPILQDALRHIYQRCVLESNLEILLLIEKVWNILLERSPLEILVGASCPWISTWMCLAMQPAQVPIETQMMIEAKHRTKEPKNLGKGVKIQQTLKEDSHEYIGGKSAMLSGGSQEDRQTVVLQARTKAARLLGRLAPYITSSQLPTESSATESFAQVLNFHLASKSAVQQMVIGLVVEEWAQMNKEMNCPISVNQKLLEALAYTTYFDEVSQAFMRMQSECKMLVSSWSEATKEARLSQFPSAFTMEQAVSLSQSIQGQLPAAGVLFKTRQDIQQKCRQLQSSIDEINQEQQVLSIRTQACLASAVIALNALPDKLNPIIKPLMDSIKREPVAILQRGTANSLAKLLEQCAARSPCPSPKIIKNLCALLCSNPHVTPSAVQPTGSPDVLGCCGGGGGAVAVFEATGSRPSSPLLGTAPTVQCNKRFGILWLVKQQQIAALTAASRRSAFARTRSKESAVAETCPLLEQSSVFVEEVGSGQVRVQCRGARFAVVTIAGHYGADLVTRVEKLWGMMTGLLSERLNPDTFDSASVEDSDDLAQEVINSLQVFEALCPAVHGSLHPKLVAYLPHLIQGLQYPYTSVRHMAASCLAALGRIQVTATMNAILSDVLPLVGATEREMWREGALEALTCLIETLQLAVLPYVVLLVVPLLGAMSDQVECVRLTATQCFATLIRFIPLEAGIPDPPAMATSLAKQKLKERRFLEQLLDSKTLDSYELPVPIKAELRKYQQDGVNWLAFLNKYKLHGILCDDMGLGKTLQSICIMAGDHFTREQEYKASQLADRVPMPSIVICPPTLTGHWVFEIDKFCSPTYLNPLHYTGPPTERLALRSKVKDHNMVVVSYDIVRNDIDFFRTIKWNYCILDEGHIIKNGKTKLARAIKQLGAAHRVILSGTPIQNNVLELWSLFDFLLPGFLGTEKQFMAKFARPIIHSRDAKSSSKEQEAGALAMESLHRQVLPFLLRRLKEDVLDDLPPKILQDYYCELSPLQVQLYEDFAKSRAKKGVEVTITSSTGEPKDKEDKPLAPATSHIFQALQYLRKVCNHPLLVLNQKHPQYDVVMARLSEQNTSLHDIAHSPKLTALKQLLQDCGIGVEAMTGGEDREGLSGAVVGQHRVLLFCQLKSMLDIVEKDLLKKHMPNVTYLRLDGSVPAGQRHNIVHRFNNDPSIDILLLTTHVGGLGLNLTGADTVVFVEHDWNPTRDLQAMDRAHRIGQKKVVNVYRLITRGTLEEKIMGLQKFKMNIANSVITQDNSSLHSMGTNQLLDLFSLDQNRPGKSHEPKPESQGDQKQTTSSILQGLSQLWDEKQYDSEYNIDSFIQSLM